MYKTSILFCFWHGNGDCFLALPALRAFKWRFPDCRVGFATLKNRKNVPVEILSQFANDVYPILSEPWDWVESRTGTLEYGREVAMQEAIRCAKDAEYNLVREITMDPNIASFKVDRVAIEMGVHPLHDKRPMLKMTKEYFKYGKEFVKGLPRPLVFFHGVAGNFRKTLDRNMAIELIQKSNAETIIECGSNYFKNSVKYVPESIMKTAGIIANVERVACIDSVVMHVAHALKVVTTALFTITPPFQILGTDYMHIDKMKVLFRGST